MSELYAILDAERVADPERFVRDVLAGGARQVQLRAKKLAAGPMLRLARLVQPLCAEAGVPFVVNDRPDVAMLAGAQWVHLGQDDLPVELVKRSMPSLRVAVSTHDPVQALNAVRGGADAIAFGPVFPTSSKERPDPVVGIEQLARVVCDTSVPVIAIGGIDGTNVGRVAATGAVFAAVLGALVSSAEREARARALCLAARSHT